jgi:hypothetical protein
MRHLFRRSSHTTAVLATIAALAGAMPAGAASRGQFQPVFQGVPPVRPEGLTIGPIDSFTTAWHPAPGAMAVPLGKPILLKQEVAAGERVQWFGAVPVAHSRDGSLAVFSAGVAGNYTVRARVLSGHGRPSDHQILLSVMPASPASLHVGPPQIGAAEVSLDEDASNLQTMSAYFGGSIAALRQIGDGHFLTSINRNLQLDVEVNPPALASLIEWRVDGVAVALGDKISASIHTVGSHVLSAGPPANEQFLTIDTYAAHITSHVSNQDIVPEGVTVTFQATTDPPGHEADMTWVSSTKYGDCSPVMGWGPIFTVQFDDTWGPLPGQPAGEFQWLGVRCDNVVFNQDQKAGACCQGSTCVEGLTAAQCAAGGGQYQGNASSCASFPCGSASGACCVSGLCLAGVTPDECAAEGGNYQGDGTSCVPGVCALQVGACCQSGTCTDGVGQSDCDLLGGDFQGYGTDCSSSNCPLPAGACCAAGTCTDGQTAGRCAASGGIYQGDGTLCDPAACAPLTGACCTAGLCTVDSFQSCTAAGGTYQGDGTVCPAPGCAEPVGACCIGESCTDDLTPGRCAGSSGQFLGAGSHCASSDCGQGPVLHITEARIDQPGPDNDEYFEISGPPGAALDGLSYLVIGDGTGGSGVIEVAVDLTGRTIPPDGVFLAAESTLTIGGVTPDLALALNFENADNFTHVLVRGFTGLLGDDLDLDDDCQLDVAPWQELVDLVALVLNDEHPPAGTECHYGPPQVGPDAGLVPSHAVRCPDGTWRIGAADPAAGDDTPGGPNACT